MEGRDRLSTRWTFVSFHCSGYPIWRLFQHMNRVFVAVAAGVAMLVSQAGIAFAKDEDVKTKTVTLETFFRKPGYPIPEKNLPSSLKNDYSDLIVKYAKRYGVPTNLAHAVVSVESRFNPKARGSAGEVGLMQIKPATARMMGFRGTTKALYDPETNIRWGMQYLATAHQLGGGEVCSTILRYNAGHGATRMNPVSKRYCGKVQALLAG